MKKSPSEQVPAGQQHFHLVEVNIDGKGYWSRTVVAVSPEGAAAKAFALAVIEILDSLLPPGTPGAVLIESSPQAPTTAVTLHNVEEVLANGTTET